MPWFSCRRCLEVVRFADAAAAAAALCSWCGNRRAGDFDPVRWQCLRCGRWFDIGDGDEDRLVCGDCAAAEVTGPIVAQLVGGPQDGERIELAEDSAVLHAPRIAPVGAASERSAHFGVVRDRYDRVGIDDQGVRVYRYGRTE